VSNLPFRGGGFHLVMNYSSNDAVRRVECIVLDVRTTDEEWIGKGVKDSGRGLFGGNVPDETPHDIPRPFQVELRSTRLTK